jgi:HTH-type transcriptional regulator / antitoxin HigA
MTKSMQTLFKRLFMVDIKPIKTQTDYKKALLDIEALWDSKRETHDGDKLDILVTLVEKYEEKMFKIDSPDPIEAIKFAMEQKNMSRLELEKIFGSKSRVSEVLNKHRKLNLRMMRGLHNVLKIPYEILAEDYALQDSNKSS